MTFGHLQVAVPRIHNDEIVVENSACGLNTSEALMKGAAIKFCAHVCLNLKNMTNVSCSQ